MTSGSDVGRIVGPSFVADAKSFFALGFACSVSATFDIVARSYFNTVAIETKKLINSYCIVAVGLMNFQVPAKQSRRCRKDLIINQDFLYFSSFACGKKKSERLEKKVK